MTDLKQALSNTAEKIEAVLDDILSPKGAPEHRIYSAMRYTTLGGGKRLRPFLVAQSASLFDVAEMSALRTGAALELIHCYSLVHDDLPSMDDDDLRRGQPTCHRAFDEATAILCGDALQAFAFEILAKGMPKTVAGNACEVLAQAAGRDALVGGQMDDLAAERGWIEDMTDVPASEKIAWLERIHTRKTGALFSAALELGALAAGGSEEQRSALAAYGQSFGLAFQIPVALTLLARAGLVNSSQLKKRRKYAIVIAFIVPPSTALPLI